MVGICWPSFPVQQTHELSRFMPTISTFYGILIQMFWRDHAPPHFHAL
jgi:hypothetical protein